MVMARSIIQYVPCGSEGRVVMARSIIQYVPCGSEGRVVRVRSTIQYVPSVVTWDITFNGRKVTFYGVLKTRPTGGGLFRAPLSFYCDIF